MNANCVSLEDDGGYIAIRRRSNCNNVANNQLTDVVVQTGKLFAETPFWQRRVSSYAVEQISAFRWPLR